MIYSTSLFLISYYKEALLLWTYAYIIKWYELHTSFQIMILPGTIPVLVYDLCPYIWGPQDVGMYLQVFFFAGIRKNSINKSKDQTLMVLQ